MAVSLKHSFTSAKADDADTTLVRPSNWNAEHTLTLATAKLLGRATAATGAAEEVGVGTSLVIDAATTTLKRAALTGDVTATEDSNATSIASGAATLAKLDRTGTSGQLLTAQGVGSAPVWAAAATPLGVLLRAPQVLTTGTSYTTPTNCTSIYVEVVGGGGGGGGGTTIGGGGGSGAYAGKYFSVSGNTAYTYSIGAGGTGGTAGNTGGTGGNSTFVGSVTVTSAGGLGGRVAAAGTGSSASTVGGAGGVATNGDINIRGNAGSIGATGANNAGAPANYASGSGGGSFFGGSAVGVASATGTTTAGVAGLTGGGGSGAAGSAGGVGGAGGAGIIRIWEYS